MMALLAVRAPVLWFYTPMLWPAAAHLADGAAAVVYDCMDELSAFDFAPPGLRANEAALIRAADLVLTGGHAIYEAKRPLHDNIHAFPSSVDQAHFRQARAAIAIAAGPGADRRSAARLCRGDRRAHRPRAARRRAPRPGPTGRSSWSARW